MFGAGLQMNVRDHQVYKIFFMLVIIFWILDILNFPFMQMFDTTYPINELAWFLILLFLPDPE